MAYCAPIYFSQAKLFLHESRVSNISNHPFPETAARNIFFRPNARENNSICATSTSPPPTPCLRTCPPWTPSRPWTAYPGWGGRRRPSSRGRSGSPPRLKAKNWRNKMHTHTCFAKKGCFFLTWRIRISVSRRFAFRLGPDLVPPILRFKKTLFILDSAHTSVQSCQKNHWYGSHLLTQVYKIDKFITHDQSTRFQN